MYLKSNYKAYGGNKPETPLTKALTPELPPMPGVLDLDKIPRPVVAAKPSQPVALDIAELPAYRTAHEEAMNISAPPSRGSNGMFDGGYSSDPSKVKLSQAEVEHCKLAGIDPVTYARGKIRLNNEKKLGLRQNG